jgi:ketosteroid isomerase-like protein
MALSLEARAPADTPGRVSRTFAEAVSSGNLGLAVSCFSRDACFLTPDATAIRGREGIRGVLAQLIARRPRIQVEQSSVLEAGDAAFVRERWKIRSAGADGSSFIQVSSAVLFLRCLEDHWKLAIAAPWGVLVDDGEIRSPGARMHGPGA